MCHCFVQRFQQEGHDDVKKQIYLNCKCKEKHLYFVLFCKDYPFGAAYTSTMEERKCSCANGLSHEICQLCINARYLLNFLCGKFA